ncbi:hypothetical protein FisN_4Lu577 [Fistulifera solaris]|uniref:Uncharacterized protein n=1 Tax=Fistulifera solaris TaxID=1519565 RepID=A0A1Z5JZ75_FISSO|nr:hypothetical protein FisN_4Lu577 [Fistulifera solaris]|eukprot:GAX19229.1 hypothetical protein FisN_4Lu577 [Fistulifera solaris]
MYAEAWKDGDPYEVLNIPMDRLTLKALIEMAESSKKCEYESWQEEANNFEYVEDDDNDGDGEMVSSDISFEEETDPVIGETIDDKESNENGTASTSNTKRSYNYQVKTVEVPNSHVVVPKNQITRISNEARAWRKLLA